jgi:hypothetical protein
MDELGDNICAIVTGLSASSIRKASDPDHEHMLNLHHALMLDLAYQAKTKTTGPIFKVWQREMGKTESTAQNDNAESIEHLGLGLCKEVGDACDKIRRATSNASQGGADITPNEAKAILREVDDVERKASTAKQVIRAVLNQLTNKREAHAAAK